MSEIQSGPSSIAVLTSGGDAAGMNAAVRAVVLTAAHRDMKVYAVHEGYHGLVAGGDLIRVMEAGEADGILHKGGTAIGTARSKEFRTRGGRRAAARNLVERDIDALVVIGGDGSLAGADLFRQEWTELLAELVNTGEMSSDVADKHPFLRLSGVAGSIDNDMSGTDMTIGADTALHRIVEALDALQSTAASHQRTFVVEVMGRNCGYLALMSSLATAASWVLIPERPPAEDWPQQMSRDIRAGRAIGRRHSVVVLAEGARDRDGNLITADQVKTLLEKELGEDARITVLGHVQRGGAPGAYDRYLATLCGYRAVEQLLADEPDAPAQLIGLQANRVVAVPLMECVGKTHEIAEGEGISLRGGNAPARREFPRVVPDSADLPTGRGQTHPDRPTLPGRDCARRRTGARDEHRGARRGATRLGPRLDRTGGPRRISRAACRASPRDDWMDVSGWVSDGGAEIGTNRYMPDRVGIAQIAEQLAAHRIDGLLMAGGWAGYRAAHELHRHRQHYAALDIPIVCMPMTINNDVPATELSIGSDSALNSIVADVDKIRRSSVATRRVFVIEVRGRDCGYLALVSGLATGAERIYLPEEGITLDGLTADVHALAAMFRAGKRVCVVIRGEGADPIYTTEFVTTLFQKEGGDLFDARDQVLGHVQEGGNPSPFDPIQATILTARSIEFLSEQLDSGGRAGAMLGFQPGELRFTDLTRYPDLIEENIQRPLEQPWMGNRHIAVVMRD